MTGELGKPLHGGGQKGRTCEPVNTAPAVPALCSEPVDDLLIFSEQLHLRLFSDPQDELEHPLPLPGVPRPCAATLRSGALHQSVWIRLRILSRKLLSFR